MDKLHNSRELGGHFILKAIVIDFSTMLSQMVFKKEWLEVFKEKES